MKCLLLVDLQNDFCPGGALAVPQGDEVMALANRLMPRYDHVVATKDWHPADHGSFASNHSGVEIGSLGELGGLPQVFWPVHCVQESYGAEFHPDLQIESIQEVILKGTDPDVDSYSGFFDNDHRRSTGLEDLLRRWGVEAVDVMGLATDYCVLFTALDARALGFRTRVIIDGCRGVELHDGDVNRAIETLKAKGVEIIDSTRGDLEIAR